MTEQEKTEVKLENVGKIELPKIDVSKYIGTKLKINEVTEHQGVHGYYIKIETTPVDMIGDKPFCASKILGLHEDASGNIGWSDETALGKFLKRYGVEHYNNLIGKEVIIQKRIGKNETEFLTFE